MWSHSRLILLCYIVPDCVASHDSRGNRLNCTRTISRWSSETAASRGMEISSYLVDFGKALPATAARTKRPAIDRTCGAPQGSGTLRRSEILSSGGLPRCWRGPLHLARATARAHLMPGQGFCRARASSVGRRVEQARDYAGIGTPREP
jgi:hypothetical protein